MDDRDYRNDLVALLIAIMVTVAFGLLTSCKTKYVAVPETHTEYVTRTDTFSLIKTDSVILHDSVWVSQAVHGDTVYLTKEIYKYGTRLRDRYTYKTRTDTLLKTDTIAVIKPVVAELTKSQQRLITIGKLACGIGIALILGFGVVWWYRNKI